MQLRPDLVVAEPPARQPHPVEGVFDYFTERNTDRSRPVSRFCDRLKGGFSYFGQTHPHASSLRLTKNRLPSANSVNSCARFLASPR